MSVYQNTSAVAIVGDVNETVADRDPIHTIHASDMADAIGSYTRSVALVIDLSDLHMLRRALRGKDLSSDGFRAEKILSAISEAFDSGLR